MLTMKPRMRSTDALAVFKGCGNRSHCLTNLWAVSTVMTRQNAIPSSDGTSQQQPISCLIPLWDMCNHSPGVFATDFSVEKDMLECYAHRDYDRGDQVFIFYGPRPNSEFFLHNAFVPDHNVHDRVAIKLGISKDDVTGTKKSALLQRLNINATESFDVMAEPQPISDRLWAFAQVFTMTEDELDTWLEADKAETQRLLSWSDILMNDAAPGLQKAIHFLRMRLILLLRSYPVNKHKIDDETLNDRERLALRLISAEKRILSEALNHLVSNV